MGRLTFKELSLEDTRNIFNASKANVAEYFYKFEAFSDAEDWVRKAILKQDKGTKLEYVIYEGGDFIGIISPQFLTPTEVDIGMWVAVEFQGKGYGKRILKELITRLKDEGVEWVIYEADKENTASIALANSLGFSIYEESKTIVFKLHIV